METAPLERASFTDKSLIARYDFPTRMFICEPSLRAGLARSWPASGPSDAARSENRQWRRLFPSFHRRRGVAGLLRRDGRPNLQSGGAGQAVQRVTASADCVASCRNRSEAMSALGPHSLNAACRAIYVHAGEDHILPPLIRDAADPEPPRRTIEVAGDDFSLSFGVVYDEPGRAARRALRASAAALRDRGAGRPRRRRRSDEATTVSS